MPGRNVFGDNSDGEHSIGRIRNKALECPNKSDALGNFLLAGDPGGVHEVRVTYVGVVWQRQALSRNNTSRP